MKNFKDYTSDEYINSYTHYGKHQIWRRFVFTIQFKGRLLLNNNETIWRDCHF